MMIRRIGPTAPPKVQIATDPAEFARGQQQHRQASQNMDWLAAHWDELLPQAFGKFLAVAGQEAFLADDPQEAYAKASAAHPEDLGVFVQYVSPYKGSRCHACTR